jgi:transcriptional regulator with XRE-family HTH domain
MPPHYHDDSVQLWHGDCLPVMTDMPDNSVDAIVTDPPYGLGFMGKDWDDLPPGLPWAQQCLRVLRPGGHLLAFGGTRTWHRLAVAVEDAGFEIRDSIAWLYGQGFPKSLDVSKAIDKRTDWASLPLLQGKVRAARTALGISQSEAARRTGLIAPDESLGGGGFMWFETGMRLPTREQYAALKAVLGLDGECDQAFEEAEREVTGTHVEWENRTNYALTSRDGLRRDVPATPAAQRWAGWGTALKPAFEPIVVARKPLAGTVAATVLAHGTGALNIDGCRVHTPGSEARSYTVKRTAPGATQNATGRTKLDDGTLFEGTTTAGRWPTNVLLDDTTATHLDTQTGTLTSGSRKPGAHTLMGYMGADVAPMPEVVGDSGGASRFFPTFRYEPKAPTTERPRVDGDAHNTVKPLDLMRWLVRLVTPPGGVVLDPFAGSGTTGEACIVEGARCVLIEQEAAHLPLILARLSKPIQPDLFGLHA